jgi:hypothetical protein
MQAESSYLLVASFMKSLLRISNSSLTVGSIAVVVPESKVPLRVLPPSFVPSFKSS